ncbi:MAG: phosphotransferase enzyme family protein, partial [Sediminibacterium sp.]
MQALFDFYGWEVQEYDTIQQGLINRTYSVKTQMGDFILQSINHNVFKSPKSIDDNINAIGAYIKNNHPDYVYTHLIPTLQGKTLIEWEGGYYRAFNKIDGYALSVLDNKLQVEEAAQQFAKFTYTLKHFDAHILQDTLVQFHDLNFRYQQFTEAIQNGNTQRIEESQNEIKLLLSFKNYVATYNNYIQHKEVKKRVTHHDTKISNVLFQKIDHLEKAICVIDLDTTMSGYYISDVGDM